MSIHAPEYSRPPPALLPRAHRILAIWENQFRERAGALTIALLAFLYLIIVLTIVIVFTFATVVESVLGPINPLATFDAPYGDLATFFFLTLLACSVGAGAIAGDLASRAMTLYLSRPITPLDYLAAKGSAIGSWMLLGIAVPGLIADILVLALGDISLPIALEAAGGILLVGLAMAAALTGLALLFSSLTSRTTLAGAGLFGFLIGTEAIVSVVSRVAQQPAVLYASVAEDGMAVARWAFGVPSSGIAPGAAGAALVVVILLAFGATYVRLTRTEVIAE